MRKLGLEPFDRALTAEYLRARMGERRRTIKACLLGQDTVAGIGNIYADEILFSAGICPLRPADSLRAAEWARLAAAIPERLAFFVQRNMLTPEEYLNGNGLAYRSASFLQVYGRAGTPCPVCGAALRRSVDGGRSNVWCPNCQKARP